MNTDKRDHAQVCLEEPERKTFSRTYYNSTNSAPESRHETFGDTKQLRDSRAVCRFFTAGLCTKGVDCSFSHELPVCQHFLKNSCIYGDECWKLHPQTEKAPGKFKHEKKVAQGATKHGDNSSQRGPCQFYEDGYCKYGNKCFDVHENSKVNPKVKKSNAVTEDKKKVICEHFQRGVCAYGDECWKVHEKPVAVVVKEKRVVKETFPDPSEKIDEVPVCEHFQKGCCAYGDTCFKRHIKMPLFKDPYGPKTVEVEKNFKNLLNSEFTMDELFLSDSETEDHIEVPKQGLVKKTKKTNKKKPRASPVNLFEVLISPNDDNNNSSSEDESDTDNDEVVTKNQEKVMKNPPTIISNAEKKRLKKENKKKLAEIASQKKIDELKESGNKEFKAGKYSLAVKLYTEAISLCGPNNPMPAIYNNRCAAFILLDRFKSALKDGRKVLEFEPTNTKAHTRVLKCCLALGKVEEGRQSMDQLVDSDEEIQEMKNDLETVDKLHNEALDFANEMSYKSAIKSINQGLERSPHCSLFHTLKAKFFALEKNVIGARKALAKLDMKDHNVKTSLYHFVTGLCYYYEDDLERAISGFGEAKKELGEAKEWHDKAMAMHNAYVSGNKVVKIGGSYSAALVCLDKGLSIDKGNSAYMAKLFYTRALLNTRYERLESALSDCTSALKYQPGYYKALAKRGSLHLEMEKYAEAVEDLTEAYRMKPSPEAFSALEDAKRRKTKAESRKPSHYQILGVDKRATLEEIKKAYRTKAREFHPDKHSNASKDEQDKMEAKMKEIAAANQCLSDSNKKEEYDRRLERMLRNDDSDMEDYDSDGEDDFCFDVNDFFFHLFGIYVGGGGVGGRFQSRTFRR